MCVSQAIKTAISNGFIKTKFKSGWDVLAQARGKSLEGGVVLPVTDGIANIIGLDFVKAGELVTFSNGVKGMVLNLGRLMCSTVIFGGNKDIIANLSYKRTFNIISTPRIGRSLGNSTNVATKTISWVVNIVYQS